jgi:hypothetical protein
MLKIKWILTAALAVCTIGVVAQAQPAAQTAPEPAGACSHKGGSCSWSGDCCMNENLCCNSGSCTTC